MGSGSSWRKKPFDLCNLNTEISCIINCKDNDKLSWRRKDKPSYEKISNDRLSLSLEKVEKDHCNMVVLRLDGQCMNAFLTTTNFESTGYLSSNKLIVLQLLVDKSVLTNEDSFKIVARNKLTHLFCIYWKLKNLVTRDNDEKVKYFSCVESAVHSFNEIFRSFTGYNWMEKSEIRYNQINNRTNIIYRHHYLKPTKRKSVDFNYDSLNSPIQELLQIVNGSPPLSYTSVPDIYKRVWANISEEHIFEARSTLFNIAFKLKDSKNRDLNINLNYNFYSLIPSGTLKKSSRVIANYTTLSSEINRLNFIEGINNNFPTKLRLLEKDSEMFKIIETAFITTHGYNHNFKISPYKVYSFDDGKVLKSEKKTLLWHGTHKSYVPGILRQGFKLPTTMGQMFGQAVYFTPCVSKASKYCYVTNSGMKMKRKRV